MQKTAYEVHISHWRSDVCSSALLVDGELFAEIGQPNGTVEFVEPHHLQHELERCAFGFERFDDPARLRLHFVEQQRFCLTTELFDARLDTLDDRLRQPNRPADPQQIRNLRTHRDPPLTQPRDPTALAPARALEPDPQT